jgi:Cu+-exporting ATPase
MLSRGWQLALATPVQLSSAGAFIVAHGMRCAVAVPIWMCWWRWVPAWPGCFSTVVTLSAAAQQHVYFEASAAVITLVLLGKLLEARARGKTTCHRQPGAAGTTPGAYRAGWPVAGHCR